jgi:hypothetical protein
MNEHLDKLVQSQLQENPFPQPTFTEELAERVRKKSVVYSERRHSGNRWLYVAGAGIVVAGLIVLGGLQVVDLYGRDEGSSLSGQNNAISSAEPVMTHPSGGRLNLFINSVQPPEGSSSGETNIKILFSSDMNQATLNSKTIQISEAKHSSQLTDLFQFNYDPQNRVLTLLPKNNDFNFGSENTVTIKISGTIQDQTEKVMGSEYSWSFKTPK